MAQRELVSELLGPAAEIDFSGAPLEPAYSTPTVVRTPKFEWDWESCFTLPSRFPLKVLNESSGTAEAQRKPAAKRPAKKKPARKKAAKAGKARGRR